MGLLPDRIPEDQPQAFRVGGKDLACLVCGGGRFWSKRILLNTAGLTFMKLDWANRDAVAVICSACGYVHSFAH
ncbi:MAG TPA: hypothetical protein VM286_09140 [Candidatus Thermoplasmatota archaeon]|nr:hypothetical protein [Candidatus Thermoplasmatota archaeon]